MHLGANNGGEGKENTGNIIAAVVFLGIFGFAVHGHSIVYPVGTQITAM